MQRTFGSIILQPLTSCKRRTRASTCPLLCVIKGPHKGCGSLCIKVLFSGFWEINSCELWKEEEMWAVASCFLIWVTANVDKGEECTSYG